VVSSVPYNNAFEDGRSQAWLRTLALAVQRERYVPMRSLRPFVLLTWLLPLPAYAADKVCAPQSMLKAVTSIEAPDLPPNHFYRVPKTLYRLGDRQGRVEEALTRKLGFIFLSL